MCLFITLAAFYASERIKFIFSNKKRVNIAFKTSSRGDSGQNTPDRRVRGVSIIVLHGEYAGTTRVRKLALHGSYTGTTRVPTRVSTRALHGYYTGPTRGIFI